MFKFSYCFTTFFKVAFIIFCCILFSLFSWTCRYWFVSDNNEGGRKFGGTQREKPVSAAQDGTGALGSLGGQNGFGSAAHRGGVSQSTLEALARTTRQFTHPDWRNRSEPVDHDLSNRPKYEPASLQASPKGYVIQPGDEYSESLRKEREDMRNGYNYVLSLAPTSPNESMQVPVKYPKSSTVHTVSSEDEGPEDLSRTSRRKRQPNKQIQQEIVYDRNANVAIPMKQLKNGPTEPQQIPIPQNLLFHDPRSVSQVGPPPMLQMKPQIAATQSSASLPSPGGNPLANMPSLIMPNPMTLVNIQNGPPPLTSPSLSIRQSLVSPASSAPILVPLNSLITQGSKIMPAPGSMASQPPGSGSDDNSQDSPGRKKRKKMDDTTVFRDPPEQSLPFNGPNKYRFYCDVCDTGFTRRYTFNRHKCKGRVEKHYCQLCDKAYLSKYKLKDHILVKHEGQTVSCPECGKRFSSRSSMEMHKKQQHEGQYSIFCKICGKGFNHTGHYYGHMNKHTNTKPFWCQQCGKRFYGSSYLHNHKQVCRGNSDLNFSCTVCDRKFKCELYLKKHMKIHDTTPIINNPDVAKPTDEDLAKAGVHVAELDESSQDSYMSNSNSRMGAGQAIFPNGPDFSDSNTNDGNSKGSEIAA